MPIFRVTAPGQQPELLEANVVRVEGGHTVLYGQAVVIGRTGRWWCAGCR